MFEKSFDMLKKKPGHKYDFIMRGGQSLKDAIFKLFQVVWKKEIQPDVWCKSSLVQVFKGKGRRDNLKNIRHLHLKNEIPKFFGHIVVNAAKDEMIENMTKFQIATKPGHRASEHLFVMKSVLSLLEYNGKSMIISLWDIKKYFDCEFLRDCMNELYRNNVRGKLYRLLFEMNKNTRIQVQTPVGVTDEVDTGEGLGQGTLEGALVSAVNLDNGVNDFFSNSEDEIMYADLMLRPLLYQDDVMKMSDSRNSAQTGNDRMESLAETKLLDYNLDKSCYLVTGNKKSRKILEDDIAANPLTVCGVAMKKVVSEKYLGDYLSSSLSDSVAVTVSKRIGLATRAIYDIRTIVDDCRAKVVGGITVAFDLWEMGVLPMLLYNSETWLSIPKQTMQQLSKLQAQFFRTVLAVGWGCPTPALYWFTGGYLMHNLILKKKLLFLHHVATLPEDSLAREVFEVQARLALPGLVEECWASLQNLGISDIDGIKSYSKNQWKRLIRSKIREENRQELLENIKKYKKIDFVELSEEPFETKQYMKTMNISQARLKFKLDSKMTPTVRMNFSSDPKFAKELWACPDCVDPQDPVGSGRRDTQGHIMDCPANRDLRDNKDLSNDMDLVSYFQAVINRRQTRES